MFIFQKKFVFILLAFLSVIEVSAGKIEDPVTTVVINAVGGLQYDLVRFKVKPGEKIKIIFTNNDDMTHNLVITRPAAREQVVQAALKLGDQGMKMNYIPKDSRVMWYVKLLLPGETKSILFTAPQKAGVYPYVCTYPGHGFVMFGAMYVTDKALPEISRDMNIPERNRLVKITGAGKNQQDHSTHTPGPQHPYPDVPPYLCRTFMPDAGPAAIAVSLPDSTSFCWDAGSCRLRYAWQGRFLDNTSVWRGHKDAYAQVLGTIFFRDKTPFPLHIEKPENIPAVKFKGYRLVARYPEFHYTIDGIEVFEILKSKPGGTGLIRTFRIPNSSKPVWFVVSPDDGVSYESSAGEWVNGTLNLSPDQAHQFTITMTKKNL